MKSSQCCSSKLMSRGGPRQRVARRLLQPRAMNIDCAIHLRRECMEIAGLRVQQVVGLYWAGCKPRNLLPGYSEIAGLHRRFLTLRKVRTRLLEKRQCFRPSDVEQELPLGDKCTHAAVMAVASFDTIGRVDTKRVMKCGDWIVGAIAAGASEADDCHDDEGTFHSRPTPQFSGGALQCEARRTCIMKWRTCGAPATPYHRRVPSKKWTPVG